MTIINNIHNKKILILDFGSQYVQLIARRLRDVGVYCELHPYDVDDETIRKFNPAGVILSGGPETVTEAHTPRVSPLIFNLGCPVLGICYGMQTMAEQLGGKVEIAQHREFGYAKARVMYPSPLLENINDRFADDGTPLLDVWMSHGDRVSVLPPDFQVMVSSANAPIAGMANEKRHFYGVQFHPEVTHTHQGHRIFERFVVEICGCPCNWTPKNIMEDAIAHIRSQVGDEKVLLAMSGGVDSSVLALLLHEAIGNQLTGVFVDNGLLRKSEAEMMQSLFEKHFGLRVIHVDAADEFLNALKSVADPEQKRKIIGKAFIDVFEREAKKIPNIKWLAQGTIYSDVIESARTFSGKAHVIKSHHNVGGLPERMHLKLLEPLRELFKDEVRQIGLSLGLPADLVHRHPFPGPGLGVRILGEVKKEYADILREADAIYLQELERHDLYHKISQAFAVFLPVKSVGVMGDGRAYDYVIALRAVETVDFMTARWAHIPYKILEKISNRIINEIPGISRVTYDISSKPPATIEWE